MIVNQAQKLENGVAFFAKRFYENRGFWPSEEWITNLLCLLDFRMLKKTGRPCIGLQYEATKDGVKIADAKQSGKGAEIVK